LRLEVTLVGYLLVDKWAAPASEREGDDAAVFGPDAELALSLEWRA
jgi:hypothetical protein